MGCQITTITLVIRLTRKVNLSVLFSILPVLANGKKRIHGDIVGASYRGIFYGKKIGSFKNCITIVPYMYEREYIVKLSKTKIKIFCDTYQRGFIVSKYILEKIYDLDSRVVFMKNMKKETIEEMETMVSAHEKKNGKIKNNKTIIEFDNFISPILSTIMRRSIKTKDFRKSVDKILKKKIIIDYHPEFKDTLSRSDIDFIDIKSEMINLNIQLYEKGDYIINKYNFALLFSKIPGFVVHYNNCIDYTVKIYFPYERRGKEIKKVSAIVQKGGSITISGPNLGKILPVLEKICYISSRFEEDLKCPLPIN